MIRKEKWMKRGARVNALGKEGVITTITYYDPWVHFIRVRLDGHKSSGKYHPTDVSPILSSEGNIVEKAYEIDMGKLSEGFLIDSIICHAENHNKAKIKLLKEVQYDDWVLKYSGENLNYINIPVKRCFSYDKVIFEGKEVIRHSIEGIKQEHKRLAKLDEISNNPNIKYCYIRKGSYYRPNHCGYTSLRTDAGVYPKDEAVSHAKSVREISLEWVDIEEHNKMINEKIAELKTRLLDE